MTAMLSASLMIVAGCHRRGASPVSTQRLFLTAPERRQLLIYEGDAADGAAPIDTVTEEAPDRPVGVAVDAAGEAFVVNANGNVRVFSPNPEHHYVSFKGYAGSNTGFVQPTAIAVNLVGSFYVADPGDGQGYGRVEWFSGGANGNLIPDRVITGAHTGIHDPRGLALDGSGRLFVADRTSNEVLVFASDARDDATPIARLDGLHQPGQLSVDSLLNVYVVNEMANSVAIFGLNGPESWTPGTTLTSKALGEPSGVAVDAAGEIAVAARGGVVFFAANATGEATPVRTLTVPSPLMGISIH